jgi:hypothetical protein
MEHLQEYLQGEDVCKLNCLACFAVFGAQNSRGFYCLELCLYRTLHTAACLQEEVEAADAAMQQEQLNQQPTAAAAAAAAAGEHDVASPAQLSASSTGGLSDSAAVGCQHALLRVAIWFHHIKSTQKRKDIVAWARELNIGEATNVGCRSQGLCSAADREH